VEEAARFFEERCRRLDDTGAAWADGVEALCAADSIRAERRLPKERIESRRNQVPLVETADLRATTINFF